MTPPIDSSGVVFTGSVLRDLQVVPEGGKGIDGECLSAGIGIDCGTGKSGGDGGWRKAGGAEIVGEGLAFLSEGGADEDEKGGLVEAEFGEARGKSPAKDGGVDVWRGREGCGREREERFRRAIHLDRYGEQSIVA